MVSGWNTVRHIGAEAPRQGVGNPHEEFRTLLNEPVIKKGGRIKATSTLYRE